MNLNIDLSKFIFSKEPPKGAWLLQYQDKIEVGAFKKDFGYMGLQLCLSSPFVFYFIFNLLHFDLMHLFISGLFLLIFIWWISTNLLGIIKIEISKDHVTVYDGLKAKKLICRIPVSEIIKVEIGSKGITKEYMKAGAANLNAKKVEIIIKTKEKISYFFAATTKNIYKSYIKYILNEYLKQKERN
jgi:hypothetical protein